MMGKLEAYKEGLERYRENREVINEKSGSVGAWLEKK